MSLLDHIYESKRAEQTPTFSEWNRQFDEARGKKDAALDATLSGVAASITAQHAEDLQKDIKKAQDKAAADVRSAYIAQGKTSDEVKDNALKELLSAVDVKRDAEQRAYNERYGNLFGQGQ